MHPSVGKAYMQFAHLLQYEGSSWSLAMAQRAVMRAMHILNVARARLPAPAADCSPAVQYVLSRLAAGEGGSGGSSGAKAADSPGDSDGATAGGVRGAAAAAVAAGAVGEDLAPLKVARLGSCGSFTFPSVTPANTPAGAVVLDDCVGGGGGVPLPLLGMSLGLGLAGGAGAAQQAGCGLMPPPAQASGASRGNSMPPPPARERAV
jgi:hypothetical protein